MLANPNEYDALTRARYPDRSRWYIVTLVVTRQPSLPDENFFAHELDPLERPGRPLESTHGDGAG